jgi:RNA polymerase-binding transcription factor DksA
MMDFKQFERKVAEVRRDNKPWSNGDLADAYEVFVAELAKKDAALEAAESIMSLIRYGHYGFCPSCGEAIHVNSIGKAVGHMGNCELLAALVQIAAAK